MTQTTTSLETAARVNQALAKERLQRDLDRLNRLRHLSMEFAGNLPAGAKERAKDLEKSLVQTVLESSKAFVRATAAVQQVASGN